MYSFHQEHKMSTPKYLSLAKCLWTHIFTNSNGINLLRIVSNNMDKIHLNDAKMSNACTILWNDLIKMFLCVRSDNSYRNDNIFTLQTFCYNILLDAWCVVRCCVVNVQWTSTFNGIASTVMMLPGKKNIHTIVVEMRGNWNKNRGWSRNSQSVTGAYRHTNTHTRKRNGYDPKSKPKNECDVLGSQMFRNRIHIFQSSLG